MEEINVFALTTHVSLTISIPILNDHERGDGVMPTNE
jgi:hypothetical protein